MHGTQARKLVVVDKCHYFLFVSVFAMFQRMAHRRQCRRASCLSRIHIHTHADTAHSSPRRSPIHISPTQFYSNFLQLCSRGCEKWPHLNYRTAHTTISYSGRVLRQSRTFSFMECGLLANASERGKTICANQNTYAIAHTWTFESSIHGWQLG